VRNWTIRQCRILIVSEFDGRQMYASYFEYEGLLVHEATHPSAALEAIRCFHADVLVTDYVFPTATIQGPAFIERVRQNRGWAQPVIVVVSGYSRREDERLALAAGADRYLVKPCLPADLLAQITYSLEMRQSGSTPRPGAPTYVGRGSYGGGLDPGTEIGRVRRQR
jgi:CheY-like chemotaxis protein